MNIQSTLRTIGTGLLIVGAVALVGGLGAVGAYHLAHPAVRVGALAGKIFEYSLFTLGGGACVRALGGKNTLVKDGRDDKTAKALAGRGLHW